MKEIRETLKFIYERGFCLARTKDGTLRDLKEQGDKAVDDAEAEIKKIVQGEYKSGYHDALNGRPFRKKAEGEL